MLVVILKNLDVQIDNPNLLLEKSVMKFKLLAQK